MLNEEDWTDLWPLRGQLKSTAHVLDVNVDYVGRDGEKDMHQLVSRVVTNVNLPLMLDSTEWQMEVVRSTSWWKVHSQLHQL